MDPAGRDAGEQPVVDRPVSVSASFEGSEQIAQARLMARSFLRELRDEHGVPVSRRATHTAELAVSELVTNAGKYAPGPCLVTFELGEDAGDALAISVWDSEPTLPTLPAPPAPPTPAAPAAEPPEPPVSATPSRQPPDPTRTGRHGLEIVLAICRSFKARREPVGKRIEVSVALTDDRPDDRPHDTAGPRRGQAA